MRSPFFVDASHLFHERFPQLNYGAAVTDLDGDGKFEIYVTGYNGRSQVLKWNGAQFVEMTDPVLANANRQAIGVAAGDMDGDGREELYVLNTDTFGGRKRYGDSLFKWVDGRWVDLFTLTENRGAQNLFAGRSVGSIDRLGTGKYGFFVANYGGPMRLYELIGGSLELIDAAPELGLNRVTGGRGLVMGPIISDQTDIFLNNENGLNSLFNNNGDGTFDEIAEKAGVIDPYENGRGVALLDADGDGRLDLVYGNWEGPHRLFVQTEDHHFADIIPAEMAYPSKVRTVIAADFDNDGYEEIFFNNIAEPNRLFGWHDNRWVLLDIGDAAEPEGTGTGAIVGDFSQTGQLYLIVSHGESTLQPLSCYRAPNSNNWLRISPQTVYGAPARGAMVKLSAGGRIQTRVIDGGSGYLCQMEPIAHFGLGAISDIDYAEILWPDGRSQRIDTLRPNTEVHVQMTRSV